METNVKPEDVVVLAETGRNPYAANNTSEAILEFFRFDAEDQRDILGRTYAELACVILLTSDPGPERATALRKALESKDAARRAAGGRR